VLRTVKRKHRVSQSSSVLEHVVNLTCDVNHRYIPIMITRMMISLRKAALSQGSVWSMGESVTNRGSGRETYNMGFVPNRAALDTRDGRILFSSITPRM